MFLTRAVNTHTHTHKNRELASQLGKGGEVEACVKRA